ncbi:ubiquitin modifier [Trichoderma arundinaceum]|uniref:Ubiquitin modifier n=1 Tax=Trichoderma arundinaceum TaxID=490622 RepID=A0A395NEJ6_TRIAR|nr:ubiquitin modifier [Trichoderma arundinaceum]
MSENDNQQSPTGQEPPPNSEHLNIKVTDNNNEVFFKIKRSTKLEKLMTAFCERQGKSLNSVRFLFDGTRVQPTDTPDACTKNKSEGACGDDAMAMKGRDDDNKLERRDTEDRRRREVCV